MSQWIKDSEKIKPKQKGKPIVHFLKKIEQNFIIKYQNQIKHLKNPVQK